jgi:hypothetical protein
MVTGPPPDTPVTTPVPLTVATAAALVVQVIGLPVSTPPLASLVVALRVTICPTTTLAVAGDTVTDATGTSVTVIAAVPLFPSLVAVIVTGPPAATAVTRPAALTVARVALLVDQLMGRPVSTLPPPSLVVAAIDTV